MPSSPGHPEHPDASRYLRAWGGLLLGAAGRAVVNPRLALDLLRTGWAFRRRRWWATAPYLPTPDPTYLRWRMYTAYGSEDAVPSVPSWLPSRCCSPTTSPSCRRPSRSPASSATRAASPKS